MIGPCSRDFWLQMSDFANLANDQAYESKKNRFPLQESSGGGAPADHRTRLQNFREDIWVSAEFKRGGCWWGAVTGKNGLLHASSSPPCTKGLETWSGSGCHLEEVTRRRSESSSFWPERRCTYLVLGTICHGGVINSVCRHESHGFRRLIMIFGFRSPCKRLECFLKFRVSSTRFQGYVQSRYERESIPIQFLDVLKNTVPCGTATLKIKLAGVLGETIFSRIRGGGI